MYMSVYVWKAASQPLKVKGDKKCARMYMASNVCVCMYADRHVCAWALSPHIPAHNDSSLGGGVLLADALRRVSLDVPRRHICVCMYMHVYVCQSVSQT